MATIHGVEVGNWYRTPAGRTFEVVSQDAEAIEVQYDDGAVEEIEPDVWLEMEPVPAVPTAAIQPPFDYTLDDDASYEADRQTLYEILGSIEFSD